jgi:hypothetical protein
MIRFAWQQFRLQAAIALAALAVVAAIVLVTGPQLVHLYKLHQMGALLNRYGSYQDIATLLFVAPVTTSHDSFMRSLPDVPAGVSKRLLQSLPAVSGALSRHEALDSRPIFLRAAGRQHRTVFAPKRLTACPCAPKRAILLQRIGHLESLRRDKSPASCQLRWSPVGSILCSELQHRRPWPAVKLLGAARDEPATSRYV